MVVVHITCYIIYFAWDGDVPFFRLPFHFSFFIRMVNGPALHSHNAIPHGVSCLIQVCTMVVHCIRCYIWVVYLLLLHQLGWRNVGY